VWTYLFSSTHAHVCTHAHSHVPAILLSPISPFLFLPLSLSLSLSRSRSLIPVLSLCFFKTPIFGEWSPSHRVRWPREYACALKKYVRECMYVNQYWLTMHMCTSSKPLPDGAIVLLSLPSSSLVARFHEPHLCSFFPFLFLYSSFKSSSLLFCFCYFTFPLSLSHFVYPSSMSYCKSSCSFIQNLKSCWRNGAKPPIPNSRPEIAQ